MARLFSDLRRAFNVGSLQCSGMLIDPGSIVQDHMVHEHHLPAGRKPWSVTTGTAHES